MYFILLMKKWYFRFLKWSKSLSLAKVFDLFYTTYNYQRHQRDIRLSDSGLWRSESHTFLRWFSDHDWERLALKPEASQKEDSQAWVDLHAASLLDALLKNENMFSTLSAMSANNRLMGIFRILFYIRDLHFYFLQNFCSCSK